MTGIKRGRFLLPLKKGRYPRLRALGLTQPTLSRQVAGLEDVLGVTLFERTLRALLLTQSGVEFLAHFRMLGDAANNISVAATGQSEAVTGHVLISAKT